MDFKNEQEVTSLNVNQLEPGLYIVQLESKDELFATFKIIKN